MNEKIKHLGKNIYQILCMLLVFGWSGVLLITSTKWVVKFNPDLPFFLTLCWILGSFILLLKIISVVGSINWTPFDSVFFEEKGAKK